MEQKFKLDIEGTVICDFGKKLHKCNVSVRVQLRTSINLKGVYIHINMYNADKKLIFLDSIYFETLDSTINRVLSYNFPHTEYPIKVIAYPSYFKNFYGYRLKLLLNAESDGELNKINKLKTETLEELEKKHGIEIRGNAFSQYDEDQEEYEIEVLFEAIGDELDYRLDYVINVYNSAGLLIGVDTLYTNSKFDGYQSYSQAVYISNGETPSNIIIYPKPKSS